MNTNTQSVALHSNDDLPTEGRADVVIVGAGLAGLSAALHLLRAFPKKRVVVLEAKTIGFGASSRCSGMLTPGVGQSLAALVRRYGAKAARNLYATSLDAVEYMDELTQQHNMDIGLRLSGQLILARGSAGRRRLSQQAKIMRELALPVSILNDSQLAQKLKLGLRAPGSGPAALHLPIAGTLNPVQLVEALAKAVTQRGGLIREQTKVAAIKSEGVQLTDGNFLNAAHMVIATNAYDTSLNAQQGRLIPMHLRMIATRPLTARELEPLGWSGREGIIDSRRVFNYFRLTEDNRLLLGGGLPRYRWRGSVKDFNADSKDAGGLIRELRKLLPSLSGVDVERTWTGVIAYARDTLPTIGSVAHHANVFHLDGWCGHGIALSVYFGRMIVDLVQGNPARNQVWFREQAPRVPSELGRWCGTRIGARASQLMDRIA